MFKGRDNHFQLPHYLQILKTFGPLFFSTKKICLKTRRGAEESKDLQNTRRDRPCKWGVYNKESFDLPQSWLATAVHHCIQISEQGENIGWWKEMPLQYLESEQEGWASDGDATFFFPKSKQKKAKINFKMNGMVIFPTLSIWVFCAAFSPLFCFVCATLFHYEFHGSTLPT